ncbi:MAG TPA: tetratricopeptide repeat protein [Trichocoleus sp.]
MAANKNRWFIGIVLIFSLVALLAVSLLPLFGSTNRRATTAGSTPTSNAQAELESRARGYELVLQREPDNKAALEGLVEAKIQLGDLQGLVDPLTRLADLNPDVADYRVLLGQAKQEMGDLEGAAQAYRQVLDQQPGNMNALQGLVALLVQQNRSQAAVGLLQDTLRDAEKLGSTGSNAVNTTSVRLLLADVYVRDQKVDQALKLYDQASQEAPEDFRPILAKALVLRGQDRQDEAKPLFDQALAMAPAQYKDQIQQMAAQGSAAPESPQPAPAAPAEPTAPPAGAVAPTTP